MKLVKKQPKKWVSRFLKKFKEIARGVVQEAVEAWKEGTKITAKKLGHYSAIKIISLWP